MTRDDFLARLATGGMFACALLVIGTVAFPFVRRAAGGTLTPGYVVGEHLDVPAEVHARAPYTVVVFARSGCALCQQMKPTFQRLIAAVAGSPSIAVAMIGPASHPEAERSFAQDIGLSEAPWLMEITSLRVASVPTVVLVDRSGVAHFVRAGGGWSPADEAELLGVVRALGAGH